MRLLTWIVGRASHGVGLACTGLTIGKYGSVEAIHGGSDVRLDVLEDLALSNLRAI